MEEEKLTGVKDSFARIVGAIVGNVLFFTRYWKIMYRETRFFYMSKIQKYIGVQ